MKFDKINTHKECDCLLDASENITSDFVRFLAKGRLRDNDFFSKWDKGQKDNGCERICGLKGISVSKVVDESEKTKIVNFYRQIFNTAPKYKSAVLIFKLNPNAGVIKSTPSNKDPQHHSFYKSDEFSLDSITQIEAIELLPKTNV